MREFPPPWLNRAVALAGLGAILYLAGPLPLAGAIALLLVVPGIEWLAVILPAGRRMGALRVLRVIGLPLLALAGLIIWRDWPAITGSATVGVLSLTALVAVCSAYVLAGAYPAALACWLVAAGRDSRDPLPLWESADAVSRRRAVFRWTLASLILALSAAAVALVSGARAVWLPRVHEAWAVLAAVGLLGALVVLARARAAGLGSPALADAQGPALLAAARRAVEGVALAAGMAPPRVRVVSHARPTAFTLMRGSSPEVLLTSGLVTLLPPQELEAVAAHEVGHLASGGVESGHALETMLDLLRVLGAAVLILYVLAAQRSVGWPWAVLLLLLIGSVLADQHDQGWSGRPSRSAEVLVLLVNPLMVAANLLAAVIQYAIGRDEDLLADLRAVEFTRHPAALHAALRRLRDDRAAAVALPAAYHQRVFAPLADQAGAPPPAQAPVETRLALLERLDPTLRAAGPVRDRAPLCPDCSRPLEVSTVDSHYGVAIAIDRCPACGGCWFDDLELYLAGADELVEAGREAGADEPGGATAARSSSGPGACPRCGTALRRAPPLGLPVDLGVWECPACRGAWMRPADLVAFGRYRQRRRMSGARQGRGGRAWH